MQGGTNKVGSDRSYTATTVKQALRITPFRVSACSNRPDPTRTETVLLRTKAVLPRLDARSRRSHVRWRDAGTSMKRRRRIVSGEIMEFLDFITVSPRPRKTLKGVALRICL